MKTRPAFCVYAAILVVTGVGAAPPYIDGSISFRGSAYLNAPIASATAFTNFSGVSAAGDTNGSYSLLGNSSPAIWAPFKFSPPATPITPLWTSVSNGVTYSFDATSMTVVFSSSNFLDIQGTGIAHITGYADTPGICTIGAQQLGSSVSFSATTTASPTNVPTIHYSMMTNGILKMSWNALPGQPYQLQTTTNLAQPVWSNTVGVITTTNPTATASYSVGSDRGRFFRVVVLP